jgi:hypothetical protein
VITRRDLLRGVTGAVGLLGWPPGHASGEPPPETTRLRLKKDPALCEAPVQVTAQLMVDRGYTDRYDLALTVVKEMPYGQWRQYDTEDTVRFFALRLREVGMLKTTPQQIIARGTDWRFLNELKQELKG